MIAKYRDWAEDEPRRFPEALCCQCRDWSDLSLRQGVFYCRNQWSCLAALQERKRDLEHQRREFKEWKREVHAA